MTIGIPCFFLYRFPRNVPKVIFPLLSFSEVGKYLLEGVDTFDTRAWVVAVGVVLGTLVVLAMATCCLFYKEYSISSLSGAVDSSRRRLQQQARREGAGEAIELIPNIIFNPIYDIQSMEVVIEPDENSNDTTPRHVNNNSVIFPTRVWHLQVQEESVPAQPDSSSSLPHFTSYF